MTSTNPFEQQKPIPGVKKIIAIASGKGGVGKSTVAANLAVALAKKLGPQKVGLLDADIYGPSVPRMFGALHQKPEIQGNKIVPVERYGLKIMSIGFLVEEDAAVVWRGPMLFKAMDQFFNDIEWGNLEYLVLDLPPGTGDVQLSIAQKVPVFGAVTVTTPQNISLADVKKSLDMWKRVQVPVFGVIENMSAFKTPSGEVVNLFPKGDLNAYLDSQKISKIGEVPFDPQLGLACEMGIPLVESQPASDAAKVFLNVAQSIIEWNGTHGS